MKIYYIRTEGTENNGFQPIICGYDFMQYKDVVRSLKERKIHYTTWIEIR